MVLVWLVALSHRCLEIKIFNWARMASCSVIQNKARCRLQSHPCQKLGECANVLIMATALSRLRLQSPCHMNFRDIVRMKGRSVRCKRRGRCHATTQRA